MVSILNGLSAAGAGIASYAGAAGLEEQKSELARQNLALADSLTTAREVNVTQPFQATMQGNQQTFQAGQTDKQIAADALRTQTTEAGASARNAATNQSALERTQLEVNKPTGELQMARALAGPNASQDQLQDALQTVIAGRAKFTFSPATQVDPADPTKTIPGVNVMNTRTGDTEFRATGTNPNKPGVGGMGSRSEVYLNRVMAAGNEAAQAAQNLMELPTTASRGYFGGRQQGTSLLAAAKETLVNSLTSQEVQDYNTLMAGVTRNLAAIETAGLAPSGSLTHSMDALTIKEGDTDMTRMRKMAELRQIVEKGLEPNLSNPRISADEKDKISGIIGQISTAIPFTHHDITVLQQSDNPKTTMADLVKSKNLGAGAQTPRTPVGDVAPAQSATTFDEYGRPMPSLSAPAASRAAAPQPAAAVVPPWVKPGDQYSPSRGQARGADGTLYGAPQ